MSLLAVLGLRPDGDPQQMRAYAAMLGTTADQIRPAGAGAANAVDAATFEGPAGSDTRLRAGRLRTRTGQRATELRALSDEVLREAGRVERGQHDWDVRKEHVERALREAAGAP